MQFFSDMWMLFTRYNSFFLEGIRNTLIIAAFAVLLGTVLGTLMAMMRMSKIPPLRFLALAYIEFIRGTPLMVQLMFIFYGLPMVGITFPDIPFIPDFSRFAAGIVAMSLNSCAYVAEIIRSGIQAVDNGQIEAARSLGMSNAQTLKEVVLPQAIRNAFPAIGNELIVNIKDSSVLMIISISELMFSARSIAGTTFRFTEVYFIEACIYLFLTSVAALLLNWVEKRVNGSGLSLPQSDTDPANMKLSRTPEQKGGNRDYDARQHS